MSFRPRVRARTRTNDDFCWGSAKDVAGARASVDETQYILHPRRHVLAVLPTMSLARRIQPLERSPVFDRALGNSHMQRLGGFPSRQQRGPRLRTIVLGCVALVTLATFVFYGGLQFTPSFNHGEADGVAPWTLRQAGPLPVTTLVVYIFSNTDPEYIENLSFFAEYGMEEGDGCEYIVIVQDDKDKTVRGLNCQCRRP